ncbi:hypothetical protein [Streptomyces sp. NPDC048057]|uniref:hypothetical protein n=1 Tax=Streptomyces sp. NPDC048057 TaxID=3155628 RepID=UPI003409CE3D
MTPADELRAAAALLRTLATAATPGPWRQHDTHLDLGGHTATVLSGHQNTTELRAWLPTMSHEPWDETRNVWADASYIALMDPTVGLALGEWLDHAATAHDASVTAAASVWPDPADAAERSAWVARQTELPALAVARALTQEQPS